MLEMRTFIFEKKNTFQHTINFHCNNCNTPVVILFHSPRCCNIKRNIRFLEYIHTSRCVTAVCLFTMYFHKDVVEVDQHVSDDMTQPLTTWHSAVQRSVNFSFTQMKLDRTMK